jgi:hypothetical protein
MYCHETEVCVRERSNESSEVPVDNKEPLYFIAQQRRWMVFISVVMRVVDYSFQ